MFILVYLCDDDDDEIWDIKEFFTSLTESPFSFYILHQSLLYQLLAVSSFGGVGSW